MPFSFDDWLKEAEADNSVGVSVKTDPDFIAHGIKLKYQSTWDKLFGEKHGEGSGPYNGRNNALVSLVGLLRYKNLPYDAALIVVQGWNRKHCDPPLEQQELQPTLQRLWNDLDPTPDIFTPPDQEWQWSSVGDLLDAPEPQWLVQNCLIKKGFNLIGGPPGGAKSWIMADLAKALATGNPWMGRIDVPQCDVLYVDEEMGISAFGDRVRRLGYPRGLSSFSYLGFQGVKLDEPEHMQRIGKWCKEHSGGVVFLDTLVRVSSYDENSNSEMRNLFTLVKMLINSTDATVIAAHHLSKSNTEAREKTDPREKFRGASDIIAAASMAYLVEADNANQCMKFYAAKSRNCSIDKSLMLSFRLEDLSDGGIKLTEVDPENPILRLRR